MAPDRIMALTFSVKAAEEMRERANRMCTEAKHCKICTFHSACHRILGQQQRQQEKSYSLVSASEQDRIIGQAKNSFFGSGNSQGNDAAGDDGESAMFKNRDLLGAISNCKNNGDLEFEGIKHREVKQLAQLYQRSLRESDLIDFDDLLVETKLLFERDDNKRRQIASGIEYLLVDEFQDTNLVQYDIAKYLSSVHRRIFVVGDPDQNIFMWRAASSRNIAMFKRDFPRALVVNLVQNYRSHEVILNTAMCLMETDGQARNLQSNASYHGQVIVKETVDDSSLVRFIRREIMRLVAPQHNTNNGNQRVKYSDIAVLFRCKYHSNELEMELREYGIPFQRKVNQTEQASSSTSSSSATETREISFIVKHLKLLDDTSNATLFFQCLQLSNLQIGSEALREIGTMHMKNSQKRFNNSRSNNGGGSILETVRQYVQMDDTYACMEEKQDLTQYCSMIQALIDMKNRKDALTTPLSIVKTLVSRSKFVDHATGEEIERYNSLLRHLNSNHVSTMKDLLSQISHFSTEISSSHGEEECKVTFSTLHSSKGLEWPIVFIFNLIEGQIPYERNENREEERRLLYVGITRAKKTLYLLCSKAQQIDKESARLHEQSPFLTQIRRRGKEWIKYEGLDPSMSRQFLSEQLHDHEVIRMIKKQKSNDEMIDDQIQENHVEVFEPESQQSEESCPSLFAPASRCSQDFYVESTPSVTLPPTISTSTYNIPIVKSSFKPPRPLNKATAVSGSKNGNGVTTNVSSQISSTTMESDGNGNKRSRSTTKVQLRISKRAKE